MSSTQRAKRWETTPFLAEWLANAVEYCHRTTEGKQAFESWIILKYGTADGRAKILSCHKPPRKKFGNFSGNARMWNSAGVDLGVCDDAVMLYHEFTATRNLVSPERTKPAVKRRRGESSLEWVARRHQSLLDGCKGPNIEWKTARAIAISEYDKVRDTVRGWRASPKMFLGVLFAKCASIIPPPWEEAPDRGPMYQLCYSMDDSFRMAAAGLNFAYMTWAHAAELFDELTRLNLNTASAVERAYKKDHKLLWRFASCQARLDYYSNSLWWNLRLEISWCEHFRPYFKRSRRKDGIAKIDIDNAYVRQHGYDSTFDELVVKVIAGTDVRHGEFLEPLQRLMSENPSEASKFSAEAFEVLGDFAIAQSFDEELFGSPFGRAMRKYALAINTSESDALSPQVCFADPIKVGPITPIHENAWNDADTVTISICNKWLHIVDRSLTIWNLLRRMGPLFVTRTETFLPQDFDEMWRDADQVLWKAAADWDRPNQSGRLATEFGLVDPADPRRPTFTEDIFELLEAELAKQERATIVPTPQSFVDSIPVTPSAKSTAQSGHAYLAASKDVQPRTKVKTRSTPTMDAGTEEDDPSAGENVEDEEPLPIALPAEYKLGKRHLKIFQRILDGGKDKTNKNNIKQGQLKWHDFEKAMRRIGFDVIQTAGSSVRFDPPAQTARPITFHRPHPETILSPHMIKWYGARLKRAYGWTTAIFSQGTEAE